MLNNPCMNIYSMYSIVTAYSYAVCDCSMCRYRNEGTIMPNKIGGSKPKKSRPEILAAIRTYRDANPGIRASAIQVQLLNDQIVKPKQLPSISLINRCVRIPLLFLENFCRFCPLSVNRMEWNSNTASQHVLLFDKTTCNIVPHH